LWREAERVVMKLVKRPAGLAREKGTPRKTRTGIRATAEPSPPKEKRRERRKEAREISRSSKADLR
jgi:hypothetical protein